MGVYLIGVYLIGVYVDLTGVYLIGVRPLGVHLMVGKKSLHPTVGIPIAVFALAIVIS
jgi:hypothetical protein